MAGYCLRLGGFHDRGQARSHPGPGYQRPRPAHQRSQLLPEYARSADCQNGFKLGHQMMVGLPESTRIDEINTAKALVKLKPKMVRIYPVLVIKNTKLEEEYKEGKYQPLSVVQAVEICKDIVRIFADKNIDIIRIGLQNTEEISDPKNEGSEVVRKKV